MSEENIPPQPPGGFINEETPNPDNIKQLAQLVSLANNELSRIDENIVGGEGNQFIQAKKFNPEATLQGFVDAGKEAGTYPGGHQHHQQPVHRLHYRQYHEPSVRDLP